MASMGTLEAVHPADLALYHRNPKVGDVVAIAASLKVNRQYRPIVVNRGTHTGRQMEVLAGNHTLKAFRDLAEANPDDTTWQSIDCYVVDVDDDRAARIVAADNRTAELGEVDDQLLLDLLSDISDLEGTGYSTDDYDDLRAALEEMDSDEPVLPEEDEDDDDEPLPEGLTNSHPHDDNAAVYDQRATRMIVLALPLEQYVWASDRLEKFVADNPDCNGANSNALLKLLGKHFGEEWPQLGAAELEDMDDERERDREDDDVE